MKILIGGAPSKFYHLQKFSQALSNIGFDSKLVLDVDIFTGFPSRKISNWFESDRKFKNLISNYKPDIIFVDRPSNFAKLSIKKGIPVLFHLRGDYWSEYKWARDTLYRGPVRRFALWYKGMIAKKCFSGAKAIIPICNYLKKIVDKRYPDKSLVMYQGIDPNDWKPQEGMKLKHPCVGLLQAASIWGKTSEMLILEPIIKSNPQITFYWAGGGIYQEKILSVLEKYDNFIWLGSLEYPKKVREFLTEIDVYALITGIDMSPLTLQEAQLMKKPVIATDVGGVSELMKDKVTGFLVRKGNSDDITDKIELLLNDKPKAEEMGNAGRKFVEENFSWEVIATKFVSELKKMSLSE
jgi:glycosyltransferase involved in cell wall biosynthesis